MANVHTICTTDDPIDSLEYHRAIKASGFEVKVLPAWRPDKAMMVENPVTYNQYIDQLAEVAGMEIDSFDQMMEALEKRHQFFHDNGCRLSDHGLETAYAETYTADEIEAIFLKIRSGKPLSSEEILKFKSCMLVEFGIMDHRRGWTQQFHLGALRNNNTRLFKALGPDTGFDSIGDFEIGRPLSRLLDRLDSTNQLAKTILYNLNPRDNELIGTMIGNFRTDRFQNPVRLDGSDQKERWKNRSSPLQPRLLSRFVGMLTDSRSFLLCPHEYFRRTLCNILGNDVEKGEIPADMELLGQMVENICFNNAYHYFGF